MNKYRIVFTDGVAVYIEATCEFEAKWKICALTGRLLTDIEHIHYTD